MHSAAVHVMQLPDAQIWHVPQELSQTPQFSGSVVSVVQMSPQQVWPDSQHSPAQQLLGSQHDTPPQQLPAAQQYTPPQQPSPAAQHWPPQQLPSAQHTEPQQL